MPLSLAFQIWYFVCILGVGHQRPWLVGCSREEAESILQICPVGAFLVRPSSLSFRSHDVIPHIRLIELPNSKIKLEGAYMVNIIYYIKKSPPQDPAEV